MGETRHQAWGLTAIAVFYLVGVIAAVVTLFSNRAATGAQLAAVHGMPWLPPVPAIALTVLMGALVVAGINSARPWGFWLVIGYMVFLLVVPPYVLGASHVSLFANVFWPLLMVVYLTFERRDFGVGRSAQQADRADNTPHPA